MHFFGIFLQKIEIAELCKGVHCVDLDESFQTHIFLQNLASIQPRTSPVAADDHRAPYGGGRTGATDAWGGARWEAGLPGWE